MISVTERASVELKSAIQSFAEREGKQDLLLRVFIQGQCGCGTVHYGMGLEEQPGAEDTVLELAGIRILVDNSSAPQMEGAEIDYMEDAMRKGFTIKNPNAAGCSCGGH